MVVSDLVQKSDALSFASCQTAMKLRECLMECHHEGQFMTDIWNDLAVFLVLERNHFRGQFYASRCTAIDLHAVWLR